MATDEERDMMMHETRGALEEMTKFIQFEINKHGHCGHADTVEEAVNALSNFELLTLVAGYLDAAHNAGGDI
jgi:hypothetical protein